MPGDWLLGFARRHSSVVLLGIFVGLALGLPILVFGAYMNARIGTQAEERVAGERRAVASLAASVVVEELADAIEDLQLASGSAEFRGALRGRDRDGLAKLLDLLQTRRTSLPTALQYTTVGVIALI